MSVITVQSIQTEQQLEQIFEIRRVVFVEEQQVDAAEEYDEFENTSTHFIALCDGVPAGTARWRTTPKGTKLERFAVLKQYRGLGIGSMLITNVLNDLPSKENVYLHAQIQVCGLYRKHGFVEVGPEFTEAGIRHYKMILKPS